MPLKKYKAYTPVQRFRQSASFEEITSKNTPEKSLTSSKKRMAGRNAQGRVTTRHRGGGEKRRYRVIDFKRDKDGVPARVATIEYDPNRSARIALLFYRDGEKRYILAPNGVGVGDTVMSGPDAEARDGNCIPIENIPTGTTIHAIELEPGKGAQMVRSAGGAAQLIAKEGQYAQVRLPSGHIRIVHVRCRATVGQVGNVDHEAIKLGKAGRKRWMGIRPSVRGVAMDPASHPHGGGEGRSPIGMPGPVSPWGKPTLGYKTRKVKRSDALIGKQRSKK